MSSVIRTGTVASFTIGDVVSPDAVAATRQAGPELTVSGRVIYLSDSGPLKNHFAIMDVEGMHTPLVVPVSRLRSATFSADRLPDGRPALGSWVRSPRQAVGDETPADGDVQPCDQATGSHCDSPWRTEEG